MFVGHYAPALALKPTATGVPLWALFVSVQLSDIVWAILVLTGVEHAQALPGGPLLTPMTFTFMPYSHSLPAVAAWAVAAGSLAALVWRRGGARGAFLVVALAVASHWLLDLPMHRGDLPLWPGAPGVGFGLLDVPVLAIAVELSLMLGGFVLYTRATRSKGPVGDFSPVIAAILTAFIYAAHVMSPPPMDDGALAWMALVTFSGFTALAAWLDHTRAPLAK